VSLAQFPPRAALDFRRRLASLTLTLTCIPLQTRRSASKQETKQVGERGGKAAGGGGKPTGE
jgi:hypothetical protein